jgi:hypothetical protein
MAGVLFFFFGFESHRMQYGGNIVAGSRGIVAYSSRG